MIGTEGWMLAIEILAAGFDSWNDHLMKLSEGYRERIEILRRSLGNGEGPHRRQGHLLTGGLRIP